MLANQILKNDLRKILDSEYIDYLNPKENEDIVNGWKEALKKYYRSLILPIPGKQNNLLNFSIDLFGIELKKSIEEQSIFLKLEVLINNLHLKVIEGVTLTGIWITIPPVLPLNLKIHFLKGKYIGTAEEICSKISFQIDIWVKSSISINTVSKTKVNWR